VSIVQSEESEIALNQETFLLLTKLQSVFTNKLHKSIFLYNMNQGKIFTVGVTVLSLLTPTQSKELLTRIVGGSAVGVSEYPFFGFPGGDILCGGTLIWNDILVSAAHCGECAWQDGVWLGGNNLNTLTSNFYDVTNMVIHPEYDSGSTANDIMLIKIDGNVSGPYAQLNFNQSLPVDGQELTAIGYGAKKEGRRVSPSLQTVNFFAVSYEECKETYGSVIFDDVMLCNGGIPEGGKDTCQGDSGGPIFLAGTNIIAGIVSFGEGCARPDTPAVNARVSAYEYWIQTTICQLSANPPAACQYMALELPRARVPTSRPTKSPRYAPTLRPTKQPITRPPIRAPTLKPTKKPIVPPTKQPIRPPTLKPTKQPIRAPSKQPIRPPTLKPTKQPIRAPTKQPIRPPTKKPTKQPIYAQTKQPVRAPTLKPTKQPIHAQTKQPIRAPTLKPTKQPIRAPTKQPIRPPTLKPTKQPISAPTKQPVTLRPTKQPVSRRPTKYPVSRRPTKQPVVSPTFPTSGISVLTAFAPTSTVPVPNELCTKKQLGERCTDSSECCGTNPLCTGLIFKVCSV
jgi:Trypsin